MTHTPIPWKAGIKHDNGLVQIIAADNTCPAQCWDYDNVEENAVLIVKAVNNFERMKDELVSLRHLLSSLLRESVHPSDVEVFQGRIDEISTLLKELGDQR